MTTEQELEALREKCQILTDEVLRMDEVIEGLENEVLRLRRFIYNSFDNEGNIRGLESIKNQAREMKQQWSKYGRD